MEYVVPQNSRAKIDAAGKTLISTTASAAEKDEALAIINNWRSSHSFPLNSFHVTLRDRAKRVDASFVTAQRLKRLSSIEAKLQRFDKMLLSRMQDIGGCRAVLKSVALVDELAQTYKKSTAKNPKRRAEFVGQKDYIRNPKPDGYRSVHLVYKYRSPSKQHEIYNGLKIEIQLRTQLQHAWATAIETVGTFTQQALKSSQGQQEWLRFFALMGSAIAMRERTPLVPGTPTNRHDLREELTKCEKHLNAINELELYAAAIQAAERAGAKKAHYFLLELDPAAKRVRITGYRRNELEKASSDYLTVERTIISGVYARDAVLVSVKSYSALKQAYPNYFLDTHRFIRAVKQAIGSPERKRHDDRQGVLFPEPSAAVPGN